MKNLLKQNNRITNRITIGIFLDIEGYINYENV